MAINTQAWAILSVLLSVTTLASSALSAELFTDYDIEPREIEPGQKTVSVKNTGFVQANDVILQIGVNGVIDNYVEKCVEGDVQQLLDNSILVMEFSRMSPRTECQIELTVSKPVSLHMVVGSDGRLTEWRSWERWSGWYDAIIVWLVVLAAEAFFIVLVLYLSPRSERFNYRRFEQHEKRLARSSKDRFDVASKADEIKKFVLREYGLSINEIDATILELIYFQKTTMAQLQKNSRLSLQQVKYRVWKLRRYELVFKEKLELHAVLNNFFDQLWQDAYRDWKSNS